MSSGQPPNTLYVVMSINMYIKKIESPKCALQILNGLHESRDIYLCSLVVVDSTPLFYKFYIL